MRSGISSGGVVFFGSTVLLLQYRDGSWTYPKGHLEPGEDKRAAARREVREEAGVDAEVGEWVGVTRYTNSRGEAREVHWYVMRAHTEQVALEDTFQAGGFFALDQARQLLSFDQDKKLLEQAIRVRAGE